MNAYNRTKQAGARGALAQYRQTGVAARVDDASPHQLIGLLMDGALERISAARGAMQNGDIAVKGELISRVITIVEGLRASVDRDRAPELGANLDALYEYMSRRLLEANLRNDPAGLDEVATLLRPLRDAWMAMAADAPGPALAGSGA